MLKKTKVDVTIELHPPLTHAHTQLRCQTRMCMSLFFHCGVTEFIWGVHIWVLCFVLNLLGHQLMGLAVYNSIALDIHFPLYCYR